MSDIKLNAPPESLAARIEALEAIQADTPNTNDVICAMTYNPPRAAEDVLALHPRVSATLAYEGVCLVAKKVRTARMWLFALSAVNATLLVVLMLR